MKTEAGKARLFLLLDFDGTLVPIQGDPAACFLSPEVREELERLTGPVQCPVAVLSGRSLADLQARMAMSSICYGGNHGLHISGCGLDFIHPAAKDAKSLIAKVRRALEKEIEGIKGAWIEDKGYTVALHYRRSARAEARAARGAFYRVIARNPEKGRLAVLRGKKVVELMPDVSWDKGKAALHILDSLAPGYVPLYVGDDLTDEAAFRELNGRGITVRVRRSKTTSAGYYLRGPSEVLRLLREVAGA